MIGCLGSLLHCQVSFYFQLASCPSYAIHASPTGPKILSAIFCAGDTVAAVTAARLLRTCSGWCPRSPGRNSPSSYCATGRHRSAIQASESLTSLLCSFGWCESPCLYVFERPRPRFQTAPKSSCSYCSFAKFLY